MAKFTKTAKLRLRRPNKDKKQKLEKAMKQSRKCANEGSNRMSSISNKYVKSPQAKGSPMWSIVQDLRNNGISLNSACVGQAVEKARESYLSQCVNGCFDNPPYFEEGFVSLHNRDNIDKIFEENGTHYVILKLFPYEKIVIPFQPGDYQDYFLEKIVNENLDYGSGEIVKYDYGYSLNLSVKKPTEFDYKPETFIGIDLGLNMISWAVALNSDGDFLNEIHFDGGEAGHVRTHYWKVRQELQESGIIDKVREIGNKEQRWMENKNHIVSRRIVEFAEQFEKPLICLENINMDVLRDRTENPKIHSWTAGKLRDFIQYKAEEKGIKTELVNPKNTSRECPKCGHVSEDNREGIDFECEECGYTNHADFVGAWNIAKKG